MPFKSRRWYDRDVPHMDIINARTILTKILKEIKICESYLWMNDPIKIKVCYNDD